MTASAPAGIRTDRYTTVAIVLHWLIALAILSLLAIGLTMTRMPQGITAYKLFQLHKSIGITVLALSLLRLLWRLTHRPPPLPAGTKPLEALAAHGTHWAFYVLMIGMPLTGWALVSSSPMNLPTVLFGLVTLPDLPRLGDLPDKKAVSDSFAAVHSTGAWIMIALLVLHVGAALMHHVIRRDEVLHHMLPFLRVRPPRSSV